MNPDSPSPETIVLRLHVACQHCGYDLYALTGDPIRCPECGGGNPYTIVLRNWSHVHEPRLTCSVTALILGPLLWLTPAWIAGMAPAWDSIWGWAWFGGTLLVAGLLGYAAPTFAVLSAILLVVPQFLTSLARLPGPLYVPMSMALFLGVILLAILASAAGAAIRRVDRQGWHPRR